MKRASIVVGLIVVVHYGVLSAQQPTSQSSQLIGMWKQNLEKSTYNPGPPPPKGSGSVRQYAAGDDGAIVAITINITPEGLPALGAISAANYDGKEYAQHTLADMRECILQKTSSTPGRVTTTERAGSPAWYEPRAPPPCRTSTRRAATSACGPASRASDERI